MVQAKAYAVNGQPKEIKAFSDVDYLQDGVKLQANEGRSLRNATQDEIAKLPQAVELSNKMSKVRETLAAQGKKLEGGLMFKVSQNDSGDFWLNVQAFRLPKKTDDDRVAEIAALPA